MSTLRWFMLLLGAIAVGAICAFASMQLHLPTHNIAAILFDFGVGVTGFFAALAAGYWLSR